MRLVVDVHGCTAWRFVDDGSDSVPSRLRGVCAQSSGAAAVCGPGVAGVPEDGEAAPAAVGVDVGADVGEGEGQGEVKQEVDGGGGVCGGAAATQWVFDATYGVVPREVRDLWKAQPPCRSRTAGAATLPPVRYSVPQTLSAHVAAGAGGKKPGRRRRVSRPEAAECGDAGAMSGAGVGAGVGAGGAGDAGVDADADAGSLVTPDATDTPTEGDNKAPPTTTTTATPFDAAADAAAAAPTTTATSKSAIRRRRRKLRSRTNSSLSEADAETAAPLTPAAVDVSAGAGGPPPAAPAAATPLRSALATGRSSKSRLTVSFGVVRVRAFKRQVGGSGGVPSSGSWALGLSSDVVLDDVAQDVDSFEVSRQQDLSARVPELTKRARKLVVGGTGHDTTLETRQWSHRAEVRASVSRTPCRRLVFHFVCVLLFSVCCQSNPLFEKLSERQRRQLYIDAQGRRADADTLNLEQAEELAAIRTSRDHVGCTCAAPEYKKWGIKRLRQACTDNAVATGGLNKVQLAAALRAALPPPTICAAEGCPCFDAGLNCCEHCRCARGCKCCNPRGLDVYEADVVAKYRSGVLETAKTNLIDVA